jgi:hypothetical protein
VQSLATVLSRVWSAVRLDTPICETAVLAAVCWARLSRTITDYHRLSQTITDYHRLSQTITDYHRLNRVTITD